MSSNSRIFVYHIYFFFILFVNFLSSLHLVSANLQILWWNLSLRLFQEKVKHHLTFLPYLLLWIHLSMMLDIIQQVIIMTQLTWKNQQIGLILLPSWKTFPFNSLSFIWIIHSNVISSANSNFFQYEASRKFNITHYYHNDKEENSNNTANDISIM